MKTKSNIFVLSLLRLNKKLFLFFFAAIGLLIMSIVVPNHDSAGESERILAEKVIEVIKKSAILNAGSSVYFEVKRGVVSINIYGLDNKVEIGEKLGALSKDIVSFSGNIKVILNFYGQRKFNETKGESGVVIKELEKSEPISIYVIHMGEINALR
jgi:hypothetical protein